MKSKALFLMILMLASNAMAKKKAWKCEMKASVINIYDDRSQNTWKEVAAQNIPDQQSDLSASIHAAYYYLGLQSNITNLCREKEFNETYTYMIEGRVPVYSTDNKPSIYMIWYKAGDESETQSAIWPWGWHRYEKYVNNLKNDAEVEAGEYHVCGFVCDKVKIQKYVESITSTVN